MSRNPLALALVLAVVAAGACVVSVVGLARPEPVFGGAPAQPSLVEPVETTAANTPAVQAPVEVLRAWDAERAEAWARGDLRLLSRLYTRDSVAGRRDRAMLGAWVARGLVVRDLRTQLLSVRELGRSSSTWTLLVTDRLAGGVAVGARVERPLPRDTATTSTVRLRLLDGRWRVAAVLPALGG